jgi:hypothetical protein
MFRAITLKEVFELHGAKTLDSRSHKTKRRRDPSSYRSEFIVRVVQGIALKVWPPYSADSISVFFQMYKVQSQNKPDQRPLWASSAIGFETCMR